MNRKIIGLVIASIILSIYLLSLASALTISSVSTSPSEIQPGGKVSISLEIKNDLNDDATDVVIRLNLNGNAQQNIPSVPFAPYQSSNEQTIDEIRKDRSKDVDFDLIANSDAESGIYKIPVEISYTYKDAIKTDSGMISIIVNAKPEMQVSSENFLIKGQANKITVKIVNSGLGNVKFLSITADTASGMRITGSNVVYIGEIASDDFDTADFNIFANQNAPSTINLPLEINYKDSRNNDIKETRSLSLRMYTQKEAIRLGLITANNTYLIVIGIIAIIILYLFYRAVKKRRKKKLKEQV